MDNRLGVKQARAVVELLWAVTASLLMAQRAVGQTVDNDLRTASEREPIVSGTVELSVHCIAVCDDLDFASAGDRMVFVFSREPVRGGEADPAVVDRLLEGYSRLRHEGQPNGCVIFQHASGEVFRVGLALWRKGPNDSTLVAKAFRTADSGERYTLVFTGRTVIGTIWVDSADPAVHSIVANVAGRRVSDADLDRCTRAATHLSEP
jgi:hypothetical protein